MADEKDIEFQTILIKVKHPETGKEYERVFAGQALLTAKEIEAYGDRPVEEVITELALSKPFNPYDEDSQVDQAHQKMVQTIREMLGKGDD